MLKYIEKHKDELIILNLINYLVLYNFIKADQLLHGIGYLLFFYVAIFAIKFTTEKLQIKNELTIKKPKQELLITLLFVTIGFVAVAINFYLKPNFQNLNILTKLPVIIGIFFFTFPVALAIYFLFKRYKLKELGLRIKPPIILLIGVMVWLITGIFSLFFYPEGILWKSAFKEMGITGLILDGIIGAALAEEFLRFILQTRLAVFIKKPAYYILIASVIWSLFHFPVTYYKTDHNLVNTLNYCLQIVPLGVVWGYLTYKTKSILPSILAHGLNLWGFQNG